MEDNNTFINSFNQRIKLGEVQLEYVSCLCSSSSYITISRKDRYGFRQNTVICISCGLLYSNPRMTKDATKWFYQSDIYRKIYEGSNYLHNAQNKIDNQHGEWIYKSIIPFLDKHQYSVLEIGCGGGWNLVSFENNGWHIVGYDFSNELTELGRSNGINCISGSVDSIQGKHDVIILNHVFEHFLDPLKNINKIKRHLNHNGLLYIAVPNIENYSINQIQNAHNYYYTKKTFIYYMSSLGLKCIAFGPAEKIHMFGIFKACSSINHNISFHSHYEISKIIKKILLITIYNKLAIIKNKLIASIQN
jgi:SAM-dependent methyltransferase|tara:strand:+ start:333 stop:1247 length:915 start_codon:yes stop_codon:yes gene_type:complete